MSQMLDLDDFPIGTLARTPSGRIGVVIKHKGAASKQDHFQRLVLHFSADPHDSVTLQPHLLEPITPMTRDRALSEPARAFWESAHGASLMDKMLNRHHLDERDRAALEQVTRGEPFRPRMQELACA
jgi:hypothetical protein